MLAPLFLFAAFATAEPAPAMKPRLTVVAVDSAAQAISDDGFSDKLRYATELQVAHTLETELSLYEFRVVSDGTPAKLCANDGTDYVLTVQAVTGFAPGPTPGIVPAGTGTIRLIATGTAAVSAQLVKCPGRIAGQAIESELLHTGVASMSGLFNTLANQVAYRIIDGMHAPQVSEPATKTTTRPRISVIASNLDAARAGSDMAVAEKLVVLAVESGLNTAEVAMVSDGSATKLCAGNATDYVLSVEAALSPDYQVFRSTPPTFPGPVPTFWTSTESTPQVSAALLRCPGTLLATSLRHAWKTLVPASPPTGNNRFSPIAQSVADDLLAQIPASSMRLPAQQ